MEQQKKKYEKPSLIDQGHMVAKTRAIATGQCWDGNPTSGDDNQKKCDT